VAVGILPVFHGAVATIPSPVLVRMERQPGALGTGVFIGNANPWVWLLPGEDSWFPDHTALQCPLMVFQSGSTSETGALLVLGTARFAFGGLVWFCVDLPGG
jgi:hypothetical protein